MNNKGADQTAWKRRLICAFVVRIWHKEVFSWRGSYSSVHSSFSGISRGHVSWWSRYRSSIWDKHGNRWGTGWAQRWCRDYGWFRCILCLFGCSFKEIWWIGGVLCMTCVGWWGIPKGGLGWWMGWGITTYSTDPRGARLGLIFVHHFPLWFRLLVLAFSTISRL